MLLKEFEALLQEHGFRVSETGGLYHLTSGKKNGIVAFDWNTYYNNKVRQVNFYHSIAQRPEALELKAYLVIHGVAVKDIV